MMRAYTALLVTLASWASMNGVTKTPFDKFKEQQALAAKQQQVQASAQASLASSQAKAAEQAHMNKPVQPAPAAWGAKATNQEHADSLRDAKARADEIKYDKAARNKMAKTSEIKQVGAMGGVMAATSGLGGALSLVTSNNSGQTEHTKTDDSTGPLKDRQTSLNKVVIDEAGNIVYKGTAQDDDSEQGQQPDSQDQEEDASSPLNSEHADDEPTQDDSQLPPLDPLDPTSYDGVDEGMSDDFYLQEQQDGEDDEFDGQADEDSESFASMYGEGF